MKEFGRRRFFAKIRNHLAILKSATNELGVTNCPTADWVRKLQATVSARARAQNQQISKTVHKPTIGFFLAFSFSKRYGQQLTAQVTLPDNFVNKLHIRTTVDKKTHKA